jgi:hypothetical protein
MNFDVLWPKSVSIQDTIFLFLLIFGLPALIFLAIRLYKLSSDRERNFLLIAYCKRFGINDFQIGILKKMLSSFSFLNIDSFFLNEVYFDESVNQYLNLIKIKIVKNTNTRLTEDFKEIKKKIEFKETTPATTRNMLSNQNIKIRLENIGFITGNIISSDAEGVLLNAYFNDAANKVKIKDSISFYYWDDFNQYEVHSIIKKITEINSVKYILAQNSKLEVKDKASQKIKINIGIPIFFTHIFKIPKELKIESHYFKGEINTFSMIGAEVFTKFKIEPSGVFLFEFKPDQESKVRFHFTGRIYDSKRIKKGRILFIKYIDMNEECRKFISNLILTKLKSLK